METIINPTTSTANLDNTLAMQIYTAINTYGNADLAFKTPSTNFDNENIVLVDKDIDSVINQINSILSNSPTTETALKASLTSDYVTTNTIYTGFKGTKTWTELKAEYVTEINI